MTAFLEAVSHARELRDHAERAFRESLVRARAHRWHENGRERSHSLEDIGQAAGLHRATIHYLLKRGETEK